MNLFFVVFSIVMFTLEALDVVVLKPGSAVLLGICLAFNTKALFDKE